MNISIAQHRSKTQMTKLWMLGRVLNLCVYNPMTLSKGRDTEISEVMHNVDIVMLPGTQLVANKDASDTEITATYRSWQLANHTHYSFGRQKRSNPFLGNSIFIHKRLEQCCEVVDASSGKREIAGRACTLRIARGLLDYTLICAYFPPRNSMPNERYMKVCSSLANFIEKQIASCPARSTPVVAVDNNSDYLQTQYNQESVGEYTVENGKQNFAGEVLAEKCSYHRMAAANTFFDCGATWFGRQSNSRIDVLWMPRTLVKLVRKCVVLKGMGKKLQHANTKYRFDHFPLLVALPMESPTLVQKPFAWDRDSMMRALHCDYGKRADFLREVEEALGGREEKEEWDKLVNDNPCSDDKWSCLNDIIGRIAK